MADDLAVRVHHLQLAGYLGQWGCLDLVIVNHHHVAVLFIPDQLGCRCAQACGQNPVIGAGLAAALGMARNSDTNLLAGLLGDPCADLVGHGGIDYAAFLLFF